MGCRPNSAHPLFLYIQHVKNSFYFKMVEKIKRGINDTWNYMKFIFQCTQIKDLLMYYLRLLSRFNSRVELLGQKPYDLQNSKYLLPESLSTSGLYHWFPQGVVQTSLIGFPESLWGLVCEAGLEVLFPLTRHSTSCLRSSCQNEWGWLTLIMQSKCGGTAQCWWRWWQRESEIMSLLHLSTSTHSSPKQTMKYRNYCFPPDSYFQTYLKTRSK